MFRHPPWATTVISPSILLDDAATATKTRFLHRKKLYQVAAMPEKVSNTLKNSKPGTKGTLAGGFAVYHPSISDRKFMWTFFLSIWYQKTRKPQPDPTWYYRALCDRLRSRMLTAVFSRSMKMVYKIPYLSKQPRPCQQKTTEWQEKHQDLTHLHALQYHMTQTWSAVNLRGTELSKAWITVTRQRTRNIRYTGMETHQKETLEASKPYTMQLHQQILELILQKGRKSVEV